MRWYLTLVRMATIRKSTDSKCWRGCGEKEPFYTVGGNANWFSHYGEECGDSLKKKMEIELPYDAVIPLLGMHTEETKSERHLYPVYIAALFTVSRTWKQPRCPLADEWIRKLWHIHSMDCYSAVKRNAWG